MSHTPLTMGQVASRFGVKQHHVRRVFTRGLLPEPERVGVYRVVRPDDLPAVERALIAAGYMKAALAGAVPA